ncbi:MAG: hypothetical protein U5R48_12830 [Gammaproteobacteria bacterium]|nr:hypothetical protein [Gammaproteobacteria bacterium]
MDAILVPGGFGERGVEGKITAAALSRGSNGVPVSSASAWACMAAVIEFARDVAGLEGANSTEFAPSPPASGRRR